MLISALFSLACLGILVSALASLKSVGQAAFGLIVFWGTPEVVNEGARQFADVPLAFFILATLALIYLYAVYKRPMLIVLSGLTAGLAAWTKNEGTLFVITMALALVVAFLRERPLTILLWYVLGVAFPLVIVAYFKLFLAPPSDVLSNSPARSIQQIMDASRHLEILHFFWSVFLGFGGWTALSLPTGIIPVLLVYFLLFRSPPEEGHRNNYVAGITMLIMQMLGYYGIYLISPYPIKWHLNFSAERLVLQLFPVVSFLILCASRTPESIVRATPAE
jgi:4-amino-4-deoxy-L-arabinose transferase-like glycosyltransferase